MTTRTDGGIPPNPEVPVRGRRRVQVPKARRKMRAIRIPTFEDKKKLQGRLEDPLAQGLPSQLLRHAVGVLPVALLATILDDPGHHGFVHVWARRLVEPSAGD